MHPMIHNIQEKIKTYKKDIFWVIFAVLALLTLVGGGLLYSKTNYKYPIKIEEKAFEVGAGEAISSTKGEFIASKNGSKYYPAGCKASNRIRLENRVYFESAIDAKAAGYELSATCK